MVNFDFSISRHVRFLDGYLDAVGRSTTTDDELVSLSCFTFGGVEGVDDLFDWREGDALVKIWSREFGSFAETFVGICERSRLGFYLVDYMCWFQEFTQGATCHRRSVATDLMSEIVYRMEWPDGSKVVIAARRSKR